MLPLIRTGSQGRPYSLSLMVFEKKNQSDTEGGADEEERVHAWAREGGEAPGGLLEGGNGGNKAIIVLGKSST